MSSRGRSLWSGLNTAQFPIETLRHIHNVMAGAQQAERIAGGAPLPLPPVPAVAAAEPAHDEAAPRKRATTVASARPQARGTIAWSHTAGDEGKPNRRGTYVVWSNGKVSRQNGQGGNLTWTPRG